MPWDVVGHDGAVHLLERDLATGRLAHAYLFTGADGIGKRTLALQLAAAVNCENPPAPGVPCGVCRPCRLIPAQKHVDLVVVNPEVTGGKILVDTARGLIQTLSLKPMESRRRIALLLDFHRALPGAANALLKTIEEPPPSALLLLTAESPDELLPTIVSRCRMIALRPLAEAAVRRALEERWHIPPGRAEILSRLSGGRLGWAVAQAQDEDSQARRQELFSQWERILRSGRAERFALAQQVAEDRDDARRILPVWESFSQDLLLRILSPQAPITNLDFAATIEKLAKTIPAGRARAWLAALRRVDEQIDHNVNLKLALEAAFLDSPLN
jgi:DNA polymerase III subunit delta'